MSRESQKSCGRQRVVGAKTKVLLHVSVVGEVVQMFFDFFELVCSGWARAQGVCLRG